MHALHLSTSSGNHFIIVRNTDPPHSALLSQSTDAVNFTACEVGHWFAAIAAFVAATNPVFFYLYG